VAAETRDLALLLSSFGYPLDVVLAKCEFGIQLVSQPACGLSIVTNVMMAYPYLCVDFFLLFLAFGEEDSLSLILLKAYCILFCPSQRFGSTLVKLLGNLL
jgi:hypothetical protein